MLTIQNPYIIIQYREQRLNNMKLKVYITSIHNVILGLICDKSSVQQSHKVLTGVTANQMLYIHAVVDET